MGQNFPQLVEATSTTERNKNRFLVGPTDFLLLPIFLSSPLHNQSLFSNSQSASVKHSTSLCNTHPARKSILSLSRPAYKTPNTKAQSDGKLLATWELPTHGGELETVWPLTKLVLSACSAQKLASTGSKTMVTNSQPLDTGGQVLEA